MRPANCAPYGGGVASVMDEAPIGLDVLSGNKRRLRRERFMAIGLRLTASLAIVISALIVLTLAGEAWTFISQVEWSSLWEIGWFPRRGLYDVKTIVAASFIVTGVALLVAAPIGLASAIYLSEYASPRVRRILKPVLEVLAGVPSVVLGYFALQWISPNIVRSFWESASPQNMLVAGLGVGILTIPLVASVSEDALSAVPRSLREASVGLGARKITTTVHVVLPAAVSGLVAAGILAVSRALGETMVVFIAGGGGDGQLFSASPLDPGMTMTAAMASIAGGTDAVVGEALTFQSLFFVGLLLFAFTLLLNLLADRFVRKVREVY
jgi:phosphate transport system permease protein